MLSYLWVSRGGAIGSAARFWISSVVAPIVIEIVDSEKKVNGFLPDLGEMMGGGLVTLEKIKVIHYRHERPESK